MPVKIYNKMAIIKARVVGNIPKILSNIAKEKIYKDKPTVEKTPI